MSHIEGVFRNQGFSRKRKGRSETIFTPGLITPVQPVTSASLSWVCPFGLTYGKPPPDTLWTLREQELEIAPCSPLHNASISA